MALYSYRALDGEGRLIRGRLEAANAGDLENRLKRLGAEFISAREAWSLFFQPRRPLSRRELVNFCLQLEMLLEAGIPILDALVEMGRDSGSLLGRTLTGVEESIRGGASLSAAMADQGSTFPCVFVSLVRAGEVAGELPRVLKHLSETLKWEDELDSYARRIAIYPAFLALLILGAVVLAMLFVVPEMARLFQATGMVLPLHTRLLIGLSNGLVENWGLILGLAISLCTVSILSVRHWPAAGFVWDRTKLRLPVVGEMLHKIILGRFVAFLSLLYESGIPVLDAVRLGEDMVGNRVVRAGLQRVSVEIGQGRGVADAFEAAAVFPRLVVRMLRIGEQTGRLDRALSGVAYFYGRDVRERAARLQVLLEPLLSLLLGGLMLWVMLSVLGPIYDVITRMKL